MNMLKAAEQTVREACEKGYNLETSDISSMDYSHIQTMLTRMQEGNMSPAKMGRWLGWLQASCVYGTNNALTIEDCKRINMTWMDDNALPR